MLGSVEMFCEALQLVAGYPHETEKPECYGGPVLLLLPPGHCASGVLFRLPPPEEGEDREFQSVFSALMGGDG